MRIVPFRARAEILELDDRRRELRQRQSRRLVAMHCRHGGNSFDPKPR
jgi:hypothetical protein